MGHCVESGYGIVTEDDQLTVLDPEATPKVANAVRDSTKENGVRLSVHREKRDGAMETVDVKEID